MAAELSPIVAPVSDREAGFLTRFIYWLTRRKLMAFGSEPKVPSSLRVMAQHRGLMLSYCAFEAGFERCTSVPLRLKALAEIRAATLIGCPF